MMIMQYSKTEGGTQDLRQESAKVGLQLLVKQGFISIQANTSNYIGTANMAMLTQMDFFNKVAKDYVSNRDSGMEPVAALSKAVENFKQANDPDGIQFARIELDRNRVVDSNPFLFWKSPQERGTTLEQAAKKLG